MKATQNPIPGQATETDSLTNADPHPNTDSQPFADTTRTVPRKDDVGPAEAKPRKRRKPFVL
jgi:hypothetical protein